MARINRSLADPTGGFIGRPMTRDRKKRQSEHAWWTALDRPTMEDLQKMHDEEEGTWSKPNHGGWNGW